MFVHFHKISMPLLILIFSFAIPIGLFELGETIHVWRARNSPIVTGTVVGHEPYNRFGGIPAGRLRIQIENTKTIVVAELDRSTYERALTHRRVRFHYTGDPNTEVFLEEETNPVWLLPIFFGLPLLLLFFYVKGRGKPEFKDVFE